MEDDVWDGGALAEAVVFLRYFEDLPDPRQRGKVIYPLDEVLLLCLLAVLAGAEAITDTPGSATGSWTCRGASGRSPTARPRMIISVTSWPASTPLDSRAVSPPGLVR